MKKIWNALRYGDSQTRKCIGGVILFSVIAIGLIIFSGLTGKFGFFVIGLLSAVVAIILSQTFTLVDDSFVAEVDADGKKETIKAFSVKTVGSNVTSRELSEKKNKQEENKKQLEEPQEKPKEKMQEKPTDYNRYNQQELKRIRRKYHVKKDHRPIVIDSSDSYHIKECPAFIWRTNNKVFLLLLEKEPRKIMISRDLIHHMDYAPGISADKSKEYLAFQNKNLITNVFSEYLPDYFDAKNKKGNTRYKNLYQIYPDIRISNRSAATVMDLLYLNFMPQDKITASEKLNGFFKRVYAEHILYQDKVHSIIEYKDNIERILKEMCYAEIPMREFEVTLENLVKGRMISQEYAKHYMDMKQKVASKVH